jgi:hypothetical protein
MIDVCSQNKDVAPRGLFEQVHATQECAFPGSRGSDYAHHFTTVDVEINTPKNIVLSKTLLEVADGDDGFRLTHR